MNYMERKIKLAIREAIWEGICVGAKVKDTENPYAAQELLTQNQDFLLEKTEEIYQSLNLQIVETTNVERKASDEIL